MSGFFESFVKGLEKVLLPKINTKEMQDLKKILALSVYWDRQIADEEILFVVQSVEQKLGINGFSGNEIELVIEDFKGLLEEYQDDNKKFIEDKKWLLESITNRVLNNELNQLIIEILKSDGHLTETEEILIDTIKKNKKKETTNV